MSKKYTEVIQANALKYTATKAEVKHAQTMDRLLVKLNKENNTKKIKPDAHKYAATKAEIERTLALVRLIMK